MVEKNSWVQIHKIVLDVGKRASHLPEDTKRVPLEMWVKGYLQMDANIGDDVVIKTVTGRKETGTLVAVNPVYKHNFGNFIPELLIIDRMVKDKLYGEDDE